MNLIFMTGIVEWIQSIDGVASITVGGISLAAIVAAVWGMLKASKYGKIFLNIEKVFNASQKLIDDLTKENQKKEEELLIKEAEIKVREEEQLATTQFLMKSMSLIIAQSNGIQSLDKIALLEEAKDLKDNVIDKAKRTLQEIKNDAIKAKEVLVEETKENVEELKVDTFKEVGNLLDKYTKNKK